MQHDEVIWQVIRHKQCSYMAKIETGIFCRNPYNVTGICNRSSCPLANSRYGTIREHDGVFYLYMKTIERAHMPNNLWERVKLPRNYDMALETIDKHLLYWPKLLQHKIKQRLTKMTQMRIRMRNLALKTREEIMTMPRRKTKLERRREETAERVARLDKAIEDELLKRLNDGIYNYSEEEWIKVLDRKELVPEEKEKESEIVYVEGYEEEDMEDFSRSPSKDSADEEEEDDGVEEQVAIHKKGKRDSRKSDDDHGKSKKKIRGIVEVEQEDDGDVRQTLK